MSVLFFCEQEVRIDDDKGSPKSCITSISSSSFTISTSPPTTTTIQRFLKNQSFQSVGMDKKAEAALSVLHEEDSDDDEVESQLNGSSLGSMRALEDALPVKRGLSRFFNGKARSFANLSDAKTIEDLKKPELHFNKRKRILRASKSYSAVQVLSSLSEEEEDGTDEPGDSTVPETTKKIKVDNEMNPKM